MKKHDAASRRATSRRRKKTTKQRASQNKSRGSRGTTKSAGSCDVSANRLTRQTEEDAREPPPFAVTALGHELRPTANAISDWTKIDEATHDRGVRALLRECGVSCDDLPSTHAREIACVLVNRERRTTPAAVVLEAACDLRVLANGQTSISKAVTRAMRVVEGVWLALQRDDSRALSKPDTWASGYLEKQDEAERFSSVVMFTKPRVWSALFAESERLLGHIRERETRHPSDALRECGHCRRMGIRRSVDECKIANPMSATEAAHFVSTFLPPFLLRIAPEMAGTYAGIVEEGRLNKARATIAKTYKRAWERGKRLNARDLANLALGAFTGSRAARSYSAPDDNKRLRQRKRSARSR